MNTTTFLAAFALSLTGAALAQDHLEPEPSIYEGRASQDDILIGYDRDVVKKFGELFGWGFEVRVIVVPSFETEYGVAISSGDESPRIIGLKARTRLYDYWWITAHENSEDESTAEAVAELRASIPPTIDDVALTRCEISIDEGDRALYSGLWRQMLYDTRYLEKSRLGFDGVTYHFSGAFEHGVAGQIWRPEDGTRTDRFVKVAETIFEACSESSSAKLLTARKEAEALCAEVGCAATK